MTSLIRHVANLGLLLSFTTLAVTGVMSFVLPFSITTTRVHIVFGTATIVLVGLHLATRLDYFTRVARQSLVPEAGKKPQVPRWLVAVILVVWAGLLWSSFGNLPPAAGLLGVGYEARHKALIFRASPQTVFEQLGPVNRIATVSADSGKLVISVEIEYAQPMNEQPAAAVWAQTSGYEPRMIQTLFVDGALAYSDEPVWHGKATPRHHILPVWRHRYRDINGIDPTGDTDAVTQATPKHSFSIESVVALQDESFVICLELNAYGDTNADYTDPQIGQPSVLYTALIDPASEENYYLMTLSAHGGGAERDGSPRYDFDGLTTSRHLIEKVLVRVQRPGK